MIFNYDVSDLSGEVNDVQEQITANVQTSTTASKAYSVGDYLVLNGTLYRVTAAIANGGTITVGTNVAATNVGSELNSAIKTRRYLKTGLSITGASTIGSITLPAGHWLLLERVFVSSAGEVGLAINGGVTLHANTITNSYLHGFDVLLPATDTTYTFATNSWTTATVTQLYVEVIPIIETQLSFS